MPPLGPFTYTLTLCALRRLLCLLSVFALDMSRYVEWPSRRPFSTSCACDVKVDVRRIGLVTLNSLFTRHLNPIIDTYQSRMKWLRFPYMLDHGLGIVYRKIKISNHHRLYFSIVKWMEWKIYFKDSMWLDIRNVKYICNILVRFSSFE